MKHWLLVLVLLCSGVVLGQEETAPTDDVRVGLVLSGGGAKGFAHVGVIKMLEEAGVRIDYIAGTSMGAIVGGLYASGYNAAELDSVLREYDSNRLVRDDLPRDVSSFYQKENDGKYAITLPLVKKKIELPSAVSKGQNAFNVFSKLTEHVHNVNDFSKLDIPFFCVATDLETGEEVIMDKGYLPEAIRASGSFPGLLNPVRLGDRVLVDGGIVDNFPVEKVKAKGMDIIIGVNVSGGLKDIEDLNSLPEILMQIAGFQMYQQWDYKIKACDIYIYPDLEEFNTFSFDDRDEIIARGEEASREVYQKFVDLANRQKKKPAGHTIKKYPRNETIRITELEIRGNRNYTDLYCIKKLGIELGETMERKDFMRGIEVLTATGNFESIYYKLIPVEGGTRVEFEITENREKSFIQFGAHYDDLYKTGILVNFTTNHMLFKNDFLSADFVVGDNIRYDIDYYLDNGFNWSLGLKTRFNSFKSDFVSSIIPVVRDNDPFETGLKVPVEYYDFTTQLYFQTTFRDRSALRVGVEHKFINAHTEEIVDDEINKIHFERSHYFNAFGKLMLDTYDAKNFPKKGFYLNTEYLLYGISSNYLGNFTSFSQLSGRLGIAQTIAQRFTLHLISEAGITIGNNDNMILDYHLGGFNENYINTFVPFYGYGFSELNDSGFLRTALTLRVEFLPKNYLSFTGNFARVDDDLWNKGNIFADTNSGYGVGYGINTFLGPIELMYSWSPDKSKIYWYVNVGFWF